MRASACRPCRAYAFVSVLRMSLHLRRVTTCMCECLQVRVGPICVCSCAYVCTYFPITHLRNVTMPVSTILFCTFFHDLMMTNTSRSESGIFIAGATCPSPLLRPCSEMPPGAADDDEPLVMVVAANGCTRLTSPKLVEQWVKHVDEK